MLNRFKFAVSLLVGVFVPVIACAAECPTLDGAEKLELVAHARTCDESMAIFQDCSYGAGGDVGLGDEVVKKCEGDFLTKLNDWQRRAYDRKQARCARKYEDERGSMYRSFEAFCSAILAQKYAHRFTNKIHHEPKVDQPDN